MVLSGRLGVPGCGNVSPCLVGGIYGLVVSGLGIGRDGLGKERIVVGRRFS